jgi:tetratricopeptide (TPR) repeat protein
VPDNPRIEELRRRVQRDPTSIAFAQLAEEYRRAGRFQEAVETCCAGLEHHPGYLSARVTLGRSLVETGELDHAQAELEQVLRAAPENLTALRGLAEIHHRRGELQKALAYYRSALDLARHDPDLEQVVREIGLELEPSRRSPDVPGGLTFEQAREELLSMATAAPTGPPAMAEVVPPVPPEPPVAVPPAPPEFPVMAEAVPPVSPEFPVMAEAVPPVPPEPQEASSGDLVIAREQLALFERWLGSITEERQRRQIQS